MDDMSYYALTGRRPTTICWECDGHGRVHYHGNDEQPCDVCGGSGRLKTEGEE